MMNLRNKLTILTLIISVLIGPISFIASFLTSSYDRGFPDSRNWGDVFDPWFFGFLTSSFIFGFVAVWIIYGMIIAVHQILSIKEIFRSHKTAYNFNILTLIISLLLGPLLFMVDVLTYGVQSENWLIVGVGEFVSISIYGFVFTWSIYALVRWIILLPCCWFAKLIGIHKHQG
jgi:hypothetical protein